MLNNSISITIKPTNSCNFHCKHCFNGEHIYEKDLLPVETACKLLELTSKSYKTIKVTFHGGEPTLAGKDYYKKIFGFEKYLTEKYGVLFHNIFQTNGFLLDNELIDMLVEQKALISISFDGPHNDILRSHTEAVYSSIKQVQKKRWTFKGFLCGNIKNNF